MFYADILGDTEVTKYKVGNEYLYQGVWSRSVLLDATGYTGNVTAGTYATITIIVYAYSDYTYHQQYGSYGPDAVAMCSSFTLKVHKTT
jgi:hypothetical protein